LAPQALTKANDTNVWITPRPMTVLYIARRPTLAGIDCLQADGKPGQKGRKAEER
jgi:hypothetical protein